MKKSRFTDSQITAVLKQAQAGTSVPELYREHGIVSMVGRMKELEEEKVTTRPLRPPIAWG